MIGLIRLLQYNLEQWKQCGIDQIDGVETIDQVHLQSHEYQAEEEVEPEGAEAPGDGIDDQLPGDGEVHHNQSISKLKNTEIIYYLYYYISLY